MAKGNSRDSVQQSSVVLLSTPHRALVPPRLLCLRLSLAPSLDGFPLAAGLLLPTKLLTAGPKGGLGSRGAIRFVMLDTRGVGMETAERWAASAECQGMQECGISPFTSPHLPFPSPSLLLPRLADRDSRKGAVRRTRRRYGPRLWRNIVGRPGVLAAAWQGGLMHCMIRPFPSSALLHASAASCTMEKVGCPGCEITPHAQLATQLPTAPCNLPRRTEEGRKRVCLVKNNICNALVELVVTRRC